MKNFVKLNKNEMKMVFGGRDYIDRIGGGGGDDCFGNCTTDADCTKPNETCEAFRPSCSPVAIGFCAVDPA